MKYIWWFPTYIFKILSKKIHFVFLRNKLSKSKIFIASNTNVNETVFESNNVIGFNTNIRKSKIGFGTYLGPNCEMPQTLIGRYCSIASNVRIAYGNHPTSKFVSTHPSFFSKLKQAGFSYVNESIFEEFKYAKNDYYVNIGNDVWIGTNVTILNGVTIGDGAIIGAGAVVIKNIEPYSINVGNPSKIIKYRFSNEHITWLLKKNWWNLPINKIKELSPCYRSIEEFIKNSENEL